MKINARFDNKVDDDQQSSIILEGQGVMLKVAWCFLKRSAVIEIEEAMTTLNIHVYHKRRGKDGCESCGLRSVLLSKFRLSATEQDAAFELLETYV